MDDREIHIPMDKLRDSRTITEVNRREMKKAGLDIHRHEVVDLIDDHDANKRVLKVRKIGTFIDFGRKGAR